MLGIASTARASRKANWQTTNTCIDPAHKANLFQRSPSLRLAGARGYFFGGTMGTAHAKQRCPSARAFSCDSRSPGTSNVMFSMSKIVCADARGKACKICAIGTPQCGGKKERLCFIKGKSKDFLSKHRIFRKENRTIILFFRNLRKNKWTFSRNTTCFAMNRALFG